MHFREMIARVEWGRSGASFRLEREDNGQATAATLTTPEGEVLELSADEWRNLAAAVNRVFPAKQGDPKHPDAMNVGKPWTSELDAELTERWTAGANVDTLATHFGRAKGGITARLVRLGIVPDRQTASARR